MTPAITRLTRFTRVTRVTRFTRFTRVTSAFAIAGALLMSEANAQTNERIYEDLDFRFVTPGARAVGMGKTFVGLADDATAAASNPAGMSNLLEQEFSFEFIGTQIKHARFVPGATPPTETFGDYVATPSFLSSAVTSRNGVACLTPPTTAHTNPPCSATMRVPGESGSAAMATGRANPSATTSARSWAETAAGMRRRRVMANRAWLSRVIEVCIGSGDERQGRPGHGGLDERSRVVGG